MVESLAGPSRTGHPAGLVLRRVAALRESSLVVVLVVIAIGVGIANPRFLSLSNARDILISVAVIGAVAIGQTMVLLTRNIDLSVGSMVGITAFASTDLLARNPGMPLVVMCLFAGVFGGLLGAINGVLVAVGRVPAIVATLGTLYAFRGIDFLLAGGKQVSASDLPENYLGFANQNWFLLPAPVVIVVVLGVLASLGLRRLRAGRDLYAIGSNAEAARMMGIRVRSRVVGAFVLCGMLCGLAGFLYGAQYGSVDARAAEGLEFAVIAAVVVGGVAITGGVGTVVGALLGAAILGSIGNALNLLDLDPNWLQALSGGALVVAVTLDLVLQRRRQRRMLRAVFDR
jgi:rhamnose transport system permease protein